MRRSRSADSASPAAGVIGAANTLIFGAGGEITADNTDAPALIEALGTRIAGATALVLGAGGAGRAAVWALTEAGAAEVRVWNRTPERAVELCRQLGGEPVSEASAADLLINCTSVGLDGSESLSGLPLAAGELGRFGCVVDFVYATGGTALVRTARRLRAGDDRWTRAAGRAGGAELRAVHRLPGAGRGDARRGGRFVWCER